jgi:hypothetical protein
LLILTHLAWLVAWLSCLRCCHWFDISVVKRHPALKVLSFMECELQPIPAFTREEELTKQQALNSKTLQLLNVRNAQTMIVCP